jgi:hypothetical protein
MMLLSSPSSSRAFHRKTASRQSLIHHSQVQMLFSCFINASAVSFVPVARKAFGGCDTL